MDTLNQLVIALPICAAIFTGIWALSTFFYKEKKEERNQTSHLVVKSTIKHIGRKDDFNVAKITVSIRNNSDVKMYVHSDYLNLFGITMEPREGTEEDYLNATQKKINNKTYAHLHRYVNVRNRAIAFCGKVFDYGDYWWLEKNEKLNTSRIIFIPDRFDYAELSVVVYYSLNKDWLDVKTKQLNNEKGLCHEVYINTGKHKGQKFDWYNPEHLKLHNRFRNAEINNTSLLFLD